MPDLRDTIQSALVSFTKSSLRDSAIHLLSVLGYRSDRTVDLGNSHPQAFLEYIRVNDADDRFNKDRAMFADWKSADLLFQLTSQELSSQRSLFNETDVSTGLMQSYVFFAIELKSGD